MVVNVCPADRVNAPVEIVWELLMRPAGYGGFWDLPIDRVEPAGLAVVGQKFSGSKLCRRLRMEGEVLEVDAERHQIRFRTSMSLGIVGNNRLAIVGDNRIVCTPIDAGSCMLRYG